MAVYLLCHVALCKQELLKRVDAFIADCQVGFIAFVVRPTRLDDFLQVIRPILDPSKIGIP